MQEPAPTGIKYTDQHTEDLHKKVADESGKIVGHQVAAADVNPSNDHPFEEITDFLKKTAGHSVDMVGDRGLSTSSRDETATGQKGTSLLKEKLRRMLRRK